MEKSSSLTFVCFDRSKPKPPDWKHVYACHKAALKSRHGFAEMCFLCDEWILRADTWEQHCQAHLDRPEDLPVQCDPLMYGGVLAAPAFCPICIGNAGKPATRRMHQYRNRQTWMTHVSNCYEQDVAKQTSSLGNDKSLKCAHLHPRCAVAIHSAQGLRFHYEDVHCIEFTKGIKRCLSDTEIDIDDNADMGVDGLETPQDVTPNKACVKGTVRQTTQFKFVHETGKRKKAT